MTYNVFGGTLSLTQSINQSTCDFVTSQTFGTVKYTLCLKITRHPILTIISSNCLIKVVYSSLTPVFTDTAVTSAIIITSNVTVSLGSATSYFSYGDCGEYRFNIIYCFAAK